MTTMFSFLVETPSKPLHPEVVEVTKHSATIKWASPRQDGGSEVTGYNVEYRTRGGVMWKRANVAPVKDTKYIIENLYEDQEYEFRVVAENKAGFGQGSDVTIPVLAADPIGELSFYAVHIKNWSHIRRQT
jgi:titin